ncbi:MAG: hypothetical protein CMF49_05245 [Legionellales bacterium]|nr:hypothetical protein [Legionellales bacterium]|tara:strand:+ start:518 stop:1102 length:585 start_codon:yes stop_codon:yes gene_type:complete
MTETDDPKEQISKITEQAFSTIFDRRLTRSEIVYLLSRYPFLEICDHANPYLDESKMPKVIITDNGWHVFDYGNAIFASGSEFMCYEYGKKSKAEDEDEESGGHGTVVQQYTDVAFFVIDLVQKKRWQSIDILTGYYPMLRMAWIAADMKKIETHHFEPSIEDYVVYNWVDKIKKGKLYPPERPILSKQNIRRR